MDDVKVTFNRELLQEWVTHPVTKAIGLVIAAELVREILISKGARFLGLVSDAAGEV
ncbi:MAG TPA: hypothetical protein VGG75_05635 [Trebonia sp.]|jgi:hypothetical protein